jgi:hypothetical protein
MIEPSGTPVSAGGPGPDASTSHKPWVPQVSLLRPGISRNVGRVAHPNPPTPGAPSFRSLTAKGWETTNPNPSAFEIPVTLPLPPTAPTTIQTRSKQCPQKPLRTPYSAAFHGISCPVSTHRGSTFDVLPRPLTCRTAGRHLCVLQTAPTPSFLDAPASPLFYFHQRHAPRHRQHASPHHRSRRRANSRHSN